MWILIEIEYLTMTKKERVACAEIHRVTHTPSMQFAKSTPKHTINYQKYRSIRIEMKPLLTKHYLHPANRLIVEKNGFWIGCCRFVFRSDRLCSKPCNNWMTPLASSTPSHSHWKWKWKPSRFCSGSSAPPLHKYWIEAKPWECPDVP